MLEARNVAFAHQGAETPVIQCFSLEVAPGERVRLQGPSGRGKTTVCRLLAGYLFPQKGEVLVDGQPLPRRGACPVQLIGQHPERMLDPRLRLGDSLEEAAKGCAKGGKSAASKELLERLGIRSEWCGRFPHELSGGELQRFCIARALLANPRYLVADEISTMLDALTQAQIWTAILDEACRRRLGIVFTTHSTALAQRLATREVALPAM